MKKRMKMKKYAEGGMSDDDEGYDAYTTSVTDDEGEVLYEKPTPQAREAAPKKAAPKKADEANERAKRYARAKRAELGDTGRPTTPLRYERAKRAELGDTGRPTDKDLMGRSAMFKRGGSVKSSASRRADGIASRGKTRGRMI
jgi:hypothetical protein